MGFFDQIAATLAANLLTVMFVFGAYRITRHEENGGWSWPDWSLVAFPIILILLGLVATGQMPPPLDALAPR